MRARRARWVGSWTGRRTSTSARNVSLQLMQLFSPRAIVRTESCSARPYLIARVLRASTVPLNPRSRRNDRLAPSDSGGEEARPGTVRTDTRRVVRAVVFGMSGTPVDWRSQHRRSVQVTSWRSRGAFGRRVAGGTGRILAEECRARPWANVDELHLTTLEDLLRERGVDLPLAQRHGLVGAWHHLDPWPDVRSGLEELRQRRVTATLSNGSMALLVDLARHGNLRFDCVLSAELVRACCRRARGLRDGGGNAWKSSVLVPRWSQLIRGISKVRVRPAAERVAGPPARIRHRRSSATRSRCRRERRRPTRTGKSASARLPAARLIAAVCCCSRVSERRCSSRRATTTPLARPRNRPRSIRTRLGRAVVRFELARGNWPPSV